MHNCIAVQHTVRNFILHTINTQMHTKASSRNYDYMVPFSIMANSSVLSLMSTVGLRSQSCIHTKASSMNGVREVQKSSKIRPPVLKADSDATVVMGIASTSRAM